MKLKLITALVAAAVMSASAGAFAQSLSFGAGGSIAGSESSSNSQSNGYINNTTGWLANGTDSTSSSGAQQSTKTNKQGVITQGATFTDTSVSSFNYSSPGLKMNGSHANSGSGTGGTSQAQAFAGGGGFSAGGFTNFGW